MPSDRAWNGVLASTLNVTWIKSSRSNPNGECVEMGALPGGDIAVRNSRDPGGPALIFTRSQVTAFLRWIRGRTITDLTS